eukprot:1322682-Amorphochlora_amoeboformis.AAC.1
MTAFCYGSVCGVIGVIGGRGESVKKRGREKEGAKGGMLKRGRVLEREERARVGEREREERGRVKEIERIANRRKRNGSPGSPGLGSVEVRLDYHNKKGNSQTRDKRDVTSCHPRKFCHYRVLPVIPGTTGYATGYETISKNL